MSKTTMTIIGRTMRDAMAEAKERFGADVEILGSRRVSDGVELTARFDHAGPAIVMPVPRQRSKGIETRDEEMFSSTLAFEQARREQFAERERGMRGPASEGRARVLLPHQAEALPAVDLRTIARALPAASAQGQGVERQRESRPSTSLTPTSDPVRPRAQQNAQQNAQQAAPHAAQKAAGGAGGNGAATAGPLAAPSPAAAAAADAAGNSALMAELRSMKEFFATQIDAVRWSDQARRRPAQLVLLRRLLGRGFSAALARSLADLLPADFNEHMTSRWLTETLARTLRSCCGAGEVDPMEKGGVFALVGPTGVGKTTTIAKMAARFALKPGPQSVALITADVYRIGAQEQLRAFGRMIGIPVHVAHDQAALRELLQLLASRKLILIDTAGVGQRDARVNQLLSALDMKPVQRIVVLNAAAQAASMHDVINAYRAETAAGVVLSKVDESVQLGMAIDAVLTHRLRLLGLADGQRVPEDFHTPQFEQLVSRALQAVSGARDELALDLAQLRAMLETERV